MFGDQEILLTTPRKTKPPHQQVLLGITAAAGGALLLGNALDAYSNSVQVVTPEVTYIGTGLLAVAALAAHLLLPRYPLPWVVRGRVVRIHRLNLLPVTTLVGMVVLLWIPRFLPMAAPPPAASLPAVLDNDDREAKRPTDSETPVTQALPPPETSGTPTLDAVRAVPFYDLDLNRFLADIETDFRQTTRAEAEPGVPCYPLSTGQTTTLSALAAGSSAYAKGQLLLRLWALPVCQALEADPMRAELGTVGFYFWNRLDLSGAEINADGQRPVGTVGRYGDLIHLSHCKLENVRLWAVRFDSGDFQNATLSDVEFHIALLREAKFDHSTLVRTYLTTSDLRLSTFNHAKFVDIPSGAFSGSILCGADFSSATGLTAEALAFAILDSKTVLPRSLDRRHLRIYDSCDAHPLFAGAMSNLEGVPSKLHKFKFP